MVLRSNHQGATYIYESQLDKLRLILPKLGYNVRMDSIGTKQTLTIFNDSEDSVDDAYQIGLLVQSILT